MKPGIQTFLAEAGEAGCYALCIIEIAERATARKFDTAYSLEAGVQAGMIHYGAPSDGDNFFVRDPAGFLTLLTGVGWLVEKVAADYVPSLGEYVVDRWERGTIGHFRLPDWDSLIGSQTVANGKIASRRVFRRRRP